jgi:DNA-binding ferritin-like protein
MIKEGCGIASNFQEVMIELAATARALQLWFHGAHHTTKGTAFIGDHVNLYGAIYEKLDGELDIIIEKAIGIGEDESVACPVMLTARSLELLQQYPSPVGLTSLALVTCAKTLVRGYLGFLQHVSEELASSGELTLGLDDFLAASANGHETIVYLLGQREKVQLDA